MSNRRIIKNIKRFKQISIVIKSKWPISSIRVIFFEPLHIVRLNDLSSLLVVHSICNLVFMSSLSSISNEIAFISPSIKLWFGFKVQKSAWTTDSSKVPNRWFFTKHYFIRRLHACFVNNNFVLNIARIVNSLFQKKTRSLESQSIVRATSIRVLFLLSATLFC
ncbi:hypothetical protein Hdeb2414_s0001g00019181 [Helianthus debilis subsp. tardiflorus]